MALSYFVLFDKLKRNFDLVVFNHYFIIIIIYYHHHYLLLQFSTKITDDKKAEELKNCNQNVSDSSPSVSSNSKKSAGDVSSTLGNANLRNTENCAIRSTSINEGAKSNSQSSGNVGKANEKTPKITGLSGGKNVPILRGFSLPTLSVPRQRLFPAFHAQKKLYRTSSPVSSASPLNSGRTDSSSSCDDD